MTPPTKRLQLKVPDDPGPGTDVENSPPENDYDTDDNDVDDDVGDAIDSETSQPLEDTAGLEETAGYDVSPTSSKLTATLVGSVSLQSGVWPDLRNHQHGARQRTTSRRYRSPWRFTTHATAAGRQVRIKSHCKQDCDTNAAVSHALHKPRHGKLHR